MEKIKMTTPLVEMDGDEMTRILWKMIKDELLEPYINLKTEYYDLGLKHRNDTNDQVTVDSANADPGQPWLWILLAVVVVAGGGFAIYWLVFKKKENDKNAK